MSYDNCYIGGFVGPKGSGKSLTLACAIVWALQSGRTVWSNMKVRTGPALLNRKTFIDGSKMVYRETEPLNWDLLYMLDESMVEGMVAIDEMSYFASSRQSMDTRNRLINTCCRQARHRSLDFLYTVRAFGWVDSYLRAETDFLVTCDDLSYSGWGRDNHVSGGTVIRQRYYDLSGLMTGHPVDFLNPGAKPYKTCLFYGTPYWDCYNTHEIISIEEAFTGVKLDMKKRLISNKQEDDGTEEKVMQCLTELALNNNEIPAGMLWAYLITKGIQGEPNTLGRLIPRQVKRRYSRAEGQLYDLSA